MLALIVGCEIGGRCMVMLERGATEFRWVQGTGYAAPSRFRCKLAKEPRAASSNPAFGLLERLVEAWALGPALKDFARVRP